MRSLIAMGLIKSAIMDLTSDKETIRGDAARFFLGSDYIKQCVRAGLDTEWLRKQAAQLAGMRGKYRKEAGHNLVTEMKKRAAEKAAKSKRVTKNVL